HVAVNGVVTRNLATLADPDADRITVDGRPLPPPEARHYLLLNKPRGYVTTLSDPQGRPVVADLVDVGARLYPVGRLDWDVEGALLLTNDGALTHRLLHPRYGLPRVYEAEVEGRVAPGALARWRRGAVLDDGPATPVAVELVRARADASRLDRKSTRLNSSHVSISYAVFCFKKKTDPVTAWDVKYSYINLNATGAFQVTSLYNVAHIKVFDEITEDLNLKTKVPFTELLLC